MKRTSLAHRKPPWRCAGDDSRDEENSGGLGLPSPYFLCIIECVLGNREAQWRALEAKTNEMRSSRPRPAYLRSAVLPLPQRQRFQNKLASPKELCLRTSRPRMI